MGPSRLIGFPISIVIIEPLPVPAMTPKHLDPESFANSLLNESINDSYLGWL